MSESGSGRRGFVRDVMKRISSPGSREQESDPDAQEMTDLESVREALRFLGPEARDLVRRIERFLVEYVCG